MAEIILPPKENEETPQAPELNIDKPTTNSKVITIEFEAKKTNKVSTKDTNQQLYTTDTDAWFEFKETSLEGANGTYSVVFRNRHDGSIFQRTGDVVNGVAYYNIPHQEIRHAGKWRGQLVYTLENGNTTAREFGYDVKGHILDGKDVREIVVEDFETLMSQLRSMKDNVEQELAVLKQELENITDTAEQNEADRQAFFDDLVEDIDELQANYQELLDTGVLQTNINTKLEALEEEYAPKLTETNRQLAQTDNKVNSLFSANLHDYMEHAKTTGGVTDHTDVLKEAIESVSRGVVYIPFDVNIFDTIDIKDHITLVGDYRFNTTIHIMKDVVGLRMIGTSSGIDSFTVKVNTDNYSKTAVQLSSKLDGHSWLPKIKNIYFLNSWSNPLGVALSIKSLNGWGIMQFLIQGNMFRGFDIAVHTPSIDDGFNGWLSGNALRDNWFDFCRVGLQTDSPLSQTMIENFSGQYNSGVSEAHMNLNESDKLKIVDSSMWDGGHINVGKNAKYTTIIGGFPSQAKIKDEGYKTRIEEVLNGQDDMGNYIYEKENFEGFKLANKWDTDVKGTGYHKTGVKRVSLTAVMAKTALELGTGIEQDSFSEVDYGNNHPYRPYSNVTMNFGLFIPDTTNLTAQVGLKHGGYVSSDKIATHMFEIVDGILYPIQQRHNGTRYQLEGIPLNSNRCFVQINVLNFGSESKVLYHVDGKYVGTLNNSIEAHQLQPFFNIKNAEPEDKQLRVFDLVIRRANNFWTTTVWD